jgi:hypothetical protein
MKSFITLGPGCDTDIWFNVLFVKINEVSFYQKIISGIHSFFTFYALITTDFHNALE